MKTFPRVWRRLLRAATCTTSPKFWSMGEGAPGPPIAGSATASGRRARAAGFSPGSTGGGLAPPCRRLAARRRRDRSANGMDCAGETGSRRHSWRNHGLSLPEPMQRPASQ